MHYVDVEFCHDVVMETSVKLIAGGSHRGAAFEAMLGVPECG